MLAAYRDHAVVATSTIAYATGCLTCFCTARTGPKGLEGLEGLSVRQWICSACHTEHCRVVGTPTQQSSIENSHPQAVAGGMNKEWDTVVIRRTHFEAGHGLPAVGIPFLSA